MRQSLNGLLPTMHLEPLAAESGVRQRRRKVEAQAILWMLALGFGTGNDRTLAGLWCTYLQATGQSLIPSAFYDRFAPQSLRFLPCPGCGGACAAKRGRLQSFKLTVQDVNQRNREYSQDEISEAIDEALVNG